MKVTTKTTNASNQYTFSLNIQYKTPNTGNIAHKLIKTETTFAITISPPMLS